jgi:mutator protein MutT
MGKDQEIHLCADVILVNTFGEILLLQRCDNDWLFPGKWCLPGGHVDLGEGPEEAAIREVKEETGITLKSVKMLKKYIYEDGFASMYFLAIGGIDFDVDAIISITPKEHQKYKWVSTDDLVALGASDRLAGELFNAIITVLEIKL